METYPRPLIVNQRRASAPEIGSSNRPYGDLNTLARAESKSYIPHAEISLVPPFEVSRYPNWRGGIKFRMDLRGYIPESLLISIKGVSGGWLFALTRWRCLGILGRT